MSSAGQGCYFRVGHRGGGSLGVGGTPMLIVEIAGQKQRGHVDLGQGVGQRRQRCMNRTVRRIES